MEELKAVLECNDFSFVVTEKNNETFIPSFKLNPGDFCLLKGRNGSGKSTLLKYINHDDTSYAKVKDGNIVYNSTKDRNINTVEASMNYESMEFLRRSIVEVDQFDDSESWHSAYNMLYDPTKNSIESNKDYTKEEKENKISELKALIESFLEDEEEKKYVLPNGDKFSLINVLEVSSTKKLLRKSLRSYSGGQRKMLQVVSGIIRATITDSNLLVLDEPANNLDGKNKYYLNQLIKDLRNKNKNLAIVMISHCHVFDDINMILDIEKDESKDNLFVGKIIRKENTTKKDLFEPHKDCIEQCENIKRK